MFVSFFEFVVTSNISGRLGHILLEACLRWAAVLLLNRNPERASKILSLVDAQSRTTNQVPNLNLKNECVNGK